MAKAKSKGINHERLVKVIKGLTPEQRAKLTNSQGKPLGRRGLYGYTVTPGEQNARVCPHEVIGQLAAMTGCGVSYLYGIGPWGPK